MLTLLDVLLFRPPAHVERPGDVRRVYIRDTLPGMGELTSSETSYPLFRDLEGVRSFSAVGAFFSANVSIGRGEAARKAHAVLVTPGFLRLLGVKPLQGRLFLESESQPGRPSFVALLGYDLWRRGFGGSPDVLGQRLIVGSDVYTVVGVLPRDFKGVDLEAVDLWLPMNAADRFAGPQWAEERGLWFLEIVGRLRPGATPKAAAREATAFLRAAPKSDGPLTPSARISLGPIQRARGPEAPAAVRITAWLTGLSWIVLLIGCANVANLLLVRAFNRQRELAVRLALGASRVALARLMLWEGVALAALGALATLLVFLLTSSWLQHLVLPEAVGSAVDLDLRTLGILLILSALAGLLSGLVPALWASRGDLITTIREGGRESLPGRSRWNASLAASQIAFALVLLATAGEFARSLYNVLHLDLGMDVDPVLVATVDLTAVDYPRSRVDEIFRRAVERARELPGVQHASLAATIPFVSSMRDSLAVPGVERLPGPSVGGPFIHAVGEDFFATTGTSVLQGRSFTAQDRAGAPLVTIVNQSMARRLWPGKIPLGQCLQIGGETAPCSTVVGVVRDARQSEIQEGPTLQYYIPIGQSRKLTSRALFVRAEGNPESLRNVVRKEMQALAPDLPVVEVRSLADLLAPQIRPWRLGAAVLTLFSLLALVLAIIGLYGVIAHSMARRTYELGVRVALGAQWRDVLWLAVRQGLGIGLTGTAAGVLLVLGAARFVQPLLFQVSARDPVLLTSAAVILLGLALLASYASTRRLRSLAPGAVLRVE